jgi:hypothetical protein
VAPRGEADGRYSHGLLTAEAIEDRIALSEILERGVKRRWDTLAAIGRVTEKVVKRRFQIEKVCKRGRLRVRSPQLCGGSVYFRNVTTGYLHASATLRPIPSGVSPTVFGK